MSDFDEFFDDEGNLKSTAWKKEEEAKQRKQQALQEEVEKKRKIKELKRRKPVSYTHLTLPTSDLV